jgi:hypothetical protein
MVFEIAFVIKKTYMKRHPGLIGLLFLVLFVVSCDKDSDNNQSGDSLTTIVTQGTWRVHYFKHNGADKTSTLAGYFFTFNSNNSITATKAGNNTAGTWSETPDSGKTKLILTWVGGGIPVELLEIEEDWVLKSKSATLIELTDGADELHLSRQ